MVILYGKEGCFAFSLFVCYGCHGTILHLRVFVDPSEVIGRFSTESVW